MTAPYSKRERAEKRLLAATLGKSEAEVRRTGTRRGVFDRYQDPGPGRDAENRGAAEEYQRQHDLARYGVSGRAPKRASEEDAAWARQRLHDLGLLTQAEAKPSA